MTLRQLVKRKKCLFIPVYSMRDHVTNVYNLDNDGNFSRIKSLVHGNKNVDVLVPTNSVFSQVDFNVVRSSDYGLNAKETRYANFDNLHEIVDFNDYDVIVSEPNFLTLQLAKTMPNKVIYWCVASCTTEGNPWFVEEYADIDKQIAEHVKVYVANKAQKRWFGKNARVDKAFYDPRLNDFETIFIPFRQSDENYHVKEIRDVLLELSRRSDVKRFKVFYTDMNSSNILPSDNVFLRIDSKHELYTQMLKSKPIIPYLENDKVLQHISIIEFEYYGCRLVTMKKLHYDLSKLYDAFYKLLKK